MGDLLKLVEMFEKDQDISKLIGSGGNFFPDPATARKELHELPPVDRKKVEKILSEIIDLAQTHQMRIEGDMAQILKGINQSEQSKQACLSYNKTEQNRRKVTGEDKVPEGDQD